MRVSCAARKRSRLAKDVKEAPSFARIHRQRTGSFLQLKGHNMRQLIAIKTQKGLICKSCKDQPIVLMGPWLSSRNSYPTAGSGSPSDSDILFTLERCAVVSQAKIYFRLSLSKIRFLISYLTANAYRSCRWLRFHIQPAGNTAIDPLLNEVKRCYFWSC